MGRHHRHCHVARRLRFLWLPCSQQDEENQLGRLSLPTGDHSASDLALPSVTLSLRDVEDLVAERGTMVSYESIRRWINLCVPKMRFGVDAYIGRLVTEALEVGSPVRSSRGVVKSSSPVHGLCLLKIRKRRASVAFLVPRPYRRGHDYPSVRCRFPAFIPGAQPRFA